MKKKNMNQVEKMIDKSIRNQNTMEKYSLIKFKQILIHELKEEN